jgi:hypothetical protein
MGNNAKVSGRRSPILNAMLCAGLEVDMKRAIITATPEFLREVLHIPDGAIITDIRVPFDNPGILEIALEGAGWETPEGFYIQKAQVGTVKKNGDKLDIDWNLGA